MSALLIESSRLDETQPKLLKVDDYPGKVQQFADVTVEPYSPVVGGWVRGLRLDGSTPPAPAVRDFLCQSLLDFGFLAFEPGTVDAEHFGQLAGLFGTAKLMNTPHTPAAKDNESRVNTIDSNVKKTRMNYIWHIDQTHRHGPPRFTALFGKKVPPFGGDTLFANATAAYDLLDPQLAAYLETLTAVYDVETQGFLTLAYQDADQLATQRAKNPPIEAPLIRVHPDTGRKQILANELYTLRILGLSRVASQCLLELLFDLVRSPDVQARFRWQEGVSLIWDNRTVQHRGVGDFGQGHRLLHRAVVE